ncbi:MAG TPA: hypothetical protein VIG64_11110 [Actinomycetota bacterium]
MGGLVLTFWVMVKASAAYERARLAREAKSETAPEGGGREEEQ